MKNLILTLFFSTLALGIMAQKSTSDATRNVPAEGVLSSGRIPDMKAFTAEGTPIKVRDLCEGKYTVLAAGCLTCPLFHQNYPEIEAAFADYKDKGVQFYYFYKSLRHPELDGYVQAQNLSERLLQLAEARKKLGTKVPWIADTMDDNIRIGLRSGSWSVYLISPRGEVVYASGRIDPQGLRAALSKAVGPVQHPTQVSDLHLPKVGRAAKLVNEDSPLGVARPEGLSILSITPQNPEETYYVKLRAEADQALLRTGTGRLFLGFYPDPIHDAHWNNLAPAMRYKLTLPKGVNASPAEASANKGEGDSDAKPRQFWVDITSDRPFKAMTLKFDYFACSGDQCFALSHEYSIKMEEENRGSRTYGMNTGRTTPTKNTNQKGSRLERMDRNKDGRVSYDEMYAQMKKRNSKLTKERAHQQFDKMDTNKDGFLSAKELEAAQNNQQRSRK